MVETRSPSSETAAFDAALSALVPGLGQLNQRRFGAAAHFMIDALVLLILLVTAPSASAVAITGLVAVTLWAAIDAWRFGTRS